MKNESKEEVFEAGYSSHFLKPENRDLMFECFKKILDNRERESKRREAMTPSESEFLARTYSF